MATTNMPKNLVKFGYADSKICKVITVHTCMSYLQTILHDYLDDFCSG